MAGLLPAPEVVVASQTATLDAGLALRRIQIGAGDGAAFQALPANAFKEVAGGLDGYQRFSFEVDLDGKDAVEVIRALVGSIGIVAAVPLTTLVAAALMVRPGSPADATA